ncbi:MAG: methyltransferase domain-containing protein [Acidobacteria bacterium]|nr:methyltransferase domain-containing protein [Acidobacteriota bacterium]
MSRFLAQRDVDAVEVMDSPDCSPKLLARTYAQFPLINALVSGWHRTYRTELAPLARLARQQGSLTIVDLGCGGGDLARSMARWAAKDGLSVRITAVDPDPRAFAYATSFAARQSRRGKRQPNVSYENSSSAELVQRGEKFDVVVSNHVLHHLDAPTLAGFLADSQALATVAAVHSDIARGSAAYFLFSLLSMPLAFGSLIRQDGLTSIRRSYTPAELAAAVPQPWLVQAQGPFRNLLRWHA